jgi:hypothetical protein
MAQLPIRWRVFIPTDSHDTRFGVQDARLSVLQTRPSSFDLTLLALEGVELGTDREGRTLRRQRRTERRTERRVRHGGGHLR